MFYLAVLPLAVSSAPANLRFHVWKMRGPRLDDFCRFLRLGCCSSQFRGIPQFWEPFSPAPPEGALALLSGFGDYGSGSRLLGPSGSWGPSGNRVVRLLCPQVFTHPWDRWFRRRDGESSWDGTILSSCRSTII